MKGGAENLFKSIKDTSSKVMHNVARLVTVYMIAHLSYSNLTDWLTLSPSDKHSCIMVNGLISSLFDVASSCDIPFCQPKQLCIMLAYSSTNAYLFVFLCALFFLHYCKVDDLWYACHGCSVRLDCCIAGRDAFWTFVCLRCCSTYSK